MQRTATASSRLITSWCTVLLLQYHVVSIQIRPKRETTINDLKFVHNKFGNKFAAKISYYGAYPAGTSACTLDPLPPVTRQIGWVDVAVSKHDMYSVMACGLCLKITIQKRKENFYASIIDICSDCKKGEISMYRNGDGVDDAEVKATDCPEVVGENGFLRYRIMKSERKTLKIIIKNTKVPVIGFEVYHDDKWHCFERDSDNFFVSDGMEKLQFPATVRVTSITGQLVGFSLEKLEYDRDEVTGVQFLPFETSNKGIPTQANCIGDRKNKAANTTALFGSQNSPQVESGRDPFVNVLLRRLKSHSTGYSQEPSNRTEAMISLRRLGIQVDNNTTPEQQSGAILPDGTPTRAFKANSSYCKGKFDGSYLHPRDCEKFLLCSRGRTFVKICPLGLQFNQVEGLCDWPRHVNCGNRQSAFIKLDSDQVIEPDKDEEVYTKRFENRKNNFENITDNRFL